MQPLTAGKPTKFTRRNALRLITAGAAASLIDARWIEPGRLSITRHDRVLKQLPPALDGLRLGLLADFHFRPDQDAELLGKVVAQVHREKLDLIALVHEPDYFDTMTAHREIMLQLSGHSHGGQCRVPLIGYAPKTVKYGTKYVEGAFTNGSSNPFVTRGVGTTGSRVRFAYPPELAVLSLRAASPTG